MATVKTPNGKQYAGTVLRRITAAFFAFAAGTGAFAVEVSPDAAQEAVAGWVRLKEALGEQFDAAPASTATYQGRDGKGVFHVVSFEGGGYVVTSGDTDFTPILAWSKSGEFAATDENPLWCLIAGDTAMRAESQPSSGLSYAAATASPVATASPAAAGNAARWAALRAAAKPLSFDADDAEQSITSAPPDLRVPALAPLNDWSQSRIGNRGGTGYPVCFNYYTPANYSCGCVATSSAQVMRYFKWPQADNPVAVASFQCMSNGDNVSLSLMGGTYDWDNMPENINSYYTWSADSTETWRKAVGKLCYDAGVAVNMQYGPNGSGASVSDVPDALVNTFHYSNAVFVQSDIIDKALLPSLDAKTPCVVSIKKGSSESGHAVMADGYGYSGNTLYVHFNMGWGSSKCNVWYNPPLFDRNVYGEVKTVYDTIRGIVCNISTNAARYSSIASGRVFDRSGSVVPGVAVTATCDGETAATATTDANGIYALYLPPYASSKTYSIAATYNGSFSDPVTVSASRTYINSNSNSCDNDLELGVLYAKLVDGTFAYFGDEACMLSAETPAEGLAACKKVLFADDAEFRALVPFTNEIAAAGVPVCLHSNVTLTADTDWRAFDFDLNGKVVVLKGYDLYVHKPQGTGRITAGNVLDPFGYSFTGSSNNGGSDTYEWLWLGKEDCGAWQNFILPKSRTCYLKTKIHRFDSNYSQSVYVKIDGTEIFNESCSGTKTVGPYTCAGYTAGTSCKIEILRGKGGNTQAYKWTTVSPTSYLCFDIPEGEEYDPSDITFGGSTPGTSDFGGIGLQIHKTGKGRLVMSTAKNDIGGNGVASAVVEEGVLVNAKGAGCGEAGSRIEVMDGAQFDPHGAVSNSAYYDFTISGAGPDGLGAVANNTEEADAYKNSFVMRNITLAANAVIGGTQNVSLKNGDWNATTMTMDGHTVTYTNCTVYAGNMSYRGAGGIVVAPGAALSFYAHSPAAADCDVTVHGSLNQNNGGFTKVKSLVFENGSTCWLSDSAGSGSIPVTVVSGRYVPNASHTNGGDCTLTTPRVQLGDATHLEPTLDLSRLDGVFDGTNTTFYADSTVTVDLGEREFQGSVLLVAWMEIPTATFVVDDANKDRLGLLPRPEGLYVVLGKVPSFVKYDTANDRWAFYDEDMNPFSGEWTLGMDYMKALFADDAEFQTLAQHADEIAARHVTVFLQDDITLTADADWRAFDFDLNGKTIVLKGYDLYVRKPQGEGRITAGNVLDPFGYIFYGNSNDGGDGYPWFWLGDKWGGAQQHFTLPKTRTCYLKTKIKKYNSKYSQSVKVEISSKAIFDESCTDTSGAVKGPYTLAGYTAGTSYKIDIMRSGNGSTQASQWTTISPTSYLYFDIDEGDEYDTSNLTFGGSTPGTSDFGGLGLQIRKLGKGNLAMGAANDDIGFTGVTTLCVEEGSVENAVSTGSGPSGAKVELLYGAQFDSKAATADGIYSLVIHTDGENEGESTLIYTNATTYANAVTYVGQGAVAVAQDATLTFQNAATAADCAVNVFGGLIFAGNGLTTVKSLAFATGATFSSSGTLPTTVVTDTFAPNTTAEEGAAAAQPKVQMGDSSHLATTLDLSLIASAIDAKAMTFQSGSKVTVVVDPKNAAQRRIAISRDAETGERNGYVALWNAKPSDVEFVLGGPGADRYQLESTDEGLLLAKKPGTTVILR
ncbi:MAG: C10 family peptidase [Kiritimatiellae bacterium]|nr:C10 family peptidase [Kiritimatiellia bacterium]